jgi:hypothetical protein
VAARSLTGDGPGEAVPGFATGYTRNADSPIERVKP